MAYEKVTPAMWIQKMQDGGFKDHTCAMKSLGKTAWEQTMKDRVALLVKRYFGGHPLEQRDVDSVLSEIPEGAHKAPRAKAIPRKRSPAKQVAEAPLAAHKGNGVGIIVDQYAELKTIIGVVQDALTAIKTVREIDEKIPVPPDIDECIDMIGVVVYELGNRIPDDLKKTLANLRQEYEEASQDKGQSPKALGAATLAAPLQTLPDVPMESNAEGAALWEKTRPSRLMVRK